MGYINHVMAIKVNEKKVYPEGKQVSFHALQISQGRESLGTYTEKRQSMINERLASGF